MFKKLLDRLHDKKSRHPLGSVSNVEETLDDIPVADPHRVLFDVDQWLRDMGTHAPEIGVAQALVATRMLDEFAHGAQKDLLGIYLNPERREYLADSAWSALDGHAESLFQAYLLPFAGLRQAPEQSGEKKSLGVAAARALRAWANHKKMLRLRYRAPLDSLWSAAHEIVRQLAQLELLQFSVVAYANEAATTPLREYLIGVHLELIPLGNLVPPQIELADRFIRAQESFDFAARPGAGISHVIDLAGAQGPRRVANEDQPVGGALRFLGTARPRGALMKLAGALRKGETAPEWLVSLPLRKELVDAAILTLAMHWAPTPPQRSSQRFEQQEPLLAVFGFVMARRMAAASHFARMGRSLEYEGVDFEKMYNENRFGTIEVRPEPAPGEAEPELKIKHPLDILQRLELAGDKAQMESWMQIDGSSTGFGAVVPAILARHRIGGLVAVRYADGLEWRIGIMRRIGRDHRNRPGIGVEALDWPSIVALARPRGNVSRWTEVADAGAGHGWIDALIVSHRCHELILPGDTFVENLEVDLRSEEGNWQVRLHKLIAHGPDYDHIEFQRMD